MNAVMSFAACQILSAASGLLAALFLDGRVAPDRWWAVVPFLAAWFFSMMMHMNAIGRKEAHDA